MNQEELARELKAVRELRATLDIREHKAVTRLRERGTSWDEIAGMLGLKNRKSSHSRYERLARKIRKGSPQ